MIERRKFIRNAAGISTTAVERRKYVRFATSLEVGYCIFDDLELDKTHSRLKDISRGGIRISVPEELNTGAQVAVEIKLPEDSIPFVAFSEVVWSRKNGDLGYEAGLKFTSIQGDDKSRLLDYAYDAWMNRRRAKVSASAV